MDQRELKANNMIGVNTQDYKVIQRDLEVLKKIRGILDSKEPKPEPLIARLRRLVKENTSDSSYTRRKGRDRSRVITAGASAYQRIEDAFEATARNPSFSGGLSRLSFLNIPVLFDHTMLHNKIKISIAMESFEME